MFSDELKRLLVQVITSWQVLAVTVILVLYVFLINYVARIHHRRPSQPRMPKAKPEKTKGKAAASPQTDELGLEEASEN